MKNIIRLVWILVGIVVLASFFPTRKSREFFDAAPKASVAPPKAPKQCDMPNATKLKMEPLKSSFVPGDYDKYCKICTLKPKVNTEGKVNFLNLNCTQCQSSDKTECSETKSYDIPIPTVNISDMV